LKKLTEIKGVIKQKADKIFTAGGDTIAAADLTTATEMHLKRSQIIQVLYDIQNSITKLFGKFRTGRSQLCHTIAVTCLLPKDGRAEGKCL
jgi:DNA repair protein RAD51